MATESNLPLMALPPAGYEYTLRGVMKKTEAPKPQPDQEQESSQDPIDLHLLGLGRGVDGTDPTPWLNKSMFQVRGVDDEAIMETHEGGSLQTYVREVSSVHSQQSTLSASIDIPKAPVTIGVDAEYSRSYTTSRKAVGKKLHNRTISFKAVFDDLRTDHKTPPCTAEGKEKPCASFEERLCKWILDEVRPQGGEPRPPTEAAEIQPATSQPQLQPSSSSIEEFAAFLKTATAEEVMAIKDKCIEFVYHFRITHYVSAIELGAAKYDILEEKEFFEQVGAGVDVQTEKIGDVDFTTAVSLKKTLKDTKWSSIGVMKQNKNAWVVEEEDEAVIGVKIQPINHLVRLTQLKTFLEDALRKYMKARESDKEGPFCISCNNDKIYLKVTPGGDVVGTENPEEASEFFIFPTFDGKNPHEFTITHYEKRPSEEGKPEPVHSYLSSPVSFFGRVRGPLQMKFNVKEKRSRLTLHSRLVSRFHPMELAPWISGTDIFYINCARRIFRRNGYVCVKTTPGGQHTSVTGCVPSIKRHDGQNTFMLFRLIRSNPTNKCT